VEAKSLPSPANGEVIDHQPDPHNHEDQREQNGTAAGQSNIGTAPLGEVSV
jgi:hypothetical protein